MAAAVFLAYTIPAYLLLARTISKHFLFFQSVYSAPVAADVFLAYTIPAYLLAVIHYQKLSN